MLKYYLSAVCAAASLAATAQSNVSPFKSVRIVKEVIPPVLDVVPGSVTFVEPSNNNAIDANEKCAIRFKVKNSGKGDGYGCVAKISADGTQRGLSFRNVSLPVIKAGETQTVEIPISADMQTADGRVTFKFVIDEPQGFGTDPMELAVTTKAFEAPLVKVTDHTVTGTGTLSKKKPFDLQLLVQNTQYGTADNVRVTVTVPDGVFMTEGEAQTSFSSLSAGETKSLVYGLIVNNSYTSSEIPIRVDIRERYGRYAESKTITLALNQTMASAKIDVKAHEQKRGEIAIASLKSDVDKNIPQCNTVNDKTFALIIANENYSDVARVPYALNDGTLFAQYCQQTLGLPEKNIFLVTDAGLNKMRSEITHLCDVMKVYGGDANVIFYYAGHGVPDDASKTSFLLPVDGSGTDARTGISLESLYADLTKNDAHSVTVFLDACFSGAKRDGGMLASARGIALRVKAGKPVGNMVVFSAAQDDQTANGYDKKNHGLFTYFLLKKLQETRGNITLGELGSYVKTEVSREATVELRKRQTPSVAASSGLGTSWQSWKLIK